MTSYLTAKLVGEGYVKPDADKELPIDINYAKLAEWLVDRKQVPVDWNRKLQAIQAKAAEAARELPPGFLGQFEGGDDAPLDYFMAQKVLAKLSETAEKNLLGSLKGAAGAWEKVVKAYEYNLIFAAEAALTLCRNADYEIPFLKKQAAKYQQQLADLERRKGEARKSAAAAAAEFQQECQSLGIDSRDIRGSLLGLTAELPALMGAAVESLQADGLTQGLEYYASVVASQQQQQQQQQEGKQGVQQDAGELLPTLREVREGRTEPPAATAATQASVGAAADSSGMALQVDWDLGAALEAVGGGGEGADSAAPAGISWDLGPDDVAGASAGDGAAAAGISWDVEVEPAELAGGVDADSAGAASAAAPVDIKWDIDISGQGEDTDQTAAQQPEGSGQQQQGPGGVAATATQAAAEEPAAVKRLIEDAGYRARLLDDLFELRAFLSQRCRELSSRSSELLLAAAASEAERHVSADVAGTMLAAVSDALAKFQGDKLKQLISLRTSARYLDRLAAGLQQKAAQEAKFHGAASDAEVKRAEIQRQLMADSAKLAVLVKRTREAKEAVEAALGAKLGRRINIMGEINQLV